MKLRLLPVLSTFLISGGLLFGGWFVYQSLAVENPVGELAESLPGVKEATIESGRDTLYIRLQLEHDADLAALYESIRDRSRGEIGDRMLTIEIVDESSSDLNRIWSGALFDIAEAMDTRRYGEIPIHLNKLADNVQGLLVETAMDDANVYVTLQLDGKSKYVILPRVPNRMGVWPNEPIQ